MDGGARKLIVMVGLLALTSIISMGVLTTDGNNYPSDEEFFSGCLNLEMSGLEQVKKAVSKRKYVKARKEYIRFLKTRRNPLGEFDWRDFNKTENRKATYKTAEADKIVGNLLTACGQTYQFGVDIDWTVNPSNPYTKEWTWVLNRFDFWNTLKEAYWSTGDERYAKAFVAQLRDWITDNADPPISSFNGEGSMWRTLDAAYRISTTWLNAFYGFLASPNFNDESILMMVKSMYVHGVHLQSHPTSNNWLSMEMNALYKLATFFPEFKTAEEWQKMAADRMFKEQTAQVYPDGAQKELSPGYHGMALNNMLDIYKIATENMSYLPEGYQRGLEKMYECFLKIRLPNGRTPGVNDSYWAVNADDQIKEGLVYFPYRQDFKYIATMGERGTAPTFTSCWMPWAGWYVMRSGWEDNALYALYEVGPYASGHAHEDKLSFVLAGYGDLLLVEGGNYSYDESDFRKYVVSARAHNVSRVDGEDQNRASQRSKKGVVESLAPLNNKWITNEEFDFGEGWYTEGYGPRNNKTVSQYRALLFIRDLGWIVFDVFNPLDKNDHIYESFFHVNSSDATIDEKWAIVTSTKKEKSNIMIIPMRRDGLSVSIANGQIEPEVQGWFNTRGNEIMPIATAIYKRQSAGLCVEPYLFLPVAKGTSLSVVSTFFSYDNSCGVTLSDGTSITMKYGLKDGALSLLKYIISIPNENTQYEVKVL